MLMFRRRFDRKGQGQSEYTLILGLIAVVLIGLLYYFGTKTSDSLQGTADAMGSAGGTTTTTGAGGF